MSFRRTFVPDPDKTVPVGFFARGEPYQLFGLIPADIHLIGPVRPGDPMYLFGADRLGRDLLSRIIYGTRVSMSIGLIGVGAEPRPRHRARRHLRLLWAAPSTT